MKGFFIIAVLFLLGCSTKETKIADEIPQNNLGEEKQFTKEESIEMHRLWVKDESYKIDQYIKRHNWDAIATESGIRYFIYEKGEGRAVEQDMLITVAFEVRLINSDTTLCYSSSENGNHTFLVGMDNVESGLHEAVKYLHVGDKAYVILPYFAAHGLLGDMNKIPPLSTVLYDIYVVDAQFPE